MTYQLDTRRQSLQAKRERVRAHGWNSSSLPLRVSIADRLRVKAEADDEVGDRADAALAAAGQQA
jgi:hypothetical protein